MKGNLCHKFEVCTEELISETFKLQKSEGKKEGFIYWEEWNKTNLLIIIPRFWT